MNGNRSHSKNAKKKFRDAQLSYLVTLTFLLGTILKLEIPINYLTY